ncbi:hypothetical protein [Streptomyces jumonjinensis]|uniref:hypothetical protein n=1 Tax=Streptomyces jumonjinensis TaxID=1945 RepID=UPI0037A827EF
MFKRFGSRALTAGAAGIALVAGVPGTALADRGDATAGSGQVVVAVGWEHADFSGAQILFYAYNCVLNHEPQYIGELPEGWNDRLSSVEVTQMCDVMLYEHGNQGGSRTRLTAGVRYPNLQGFNDLTSSLKLLRPVN